MLSAIKILFMAFFDICRFRKRPQDIPESVNLLVICLLSYAGISSILIAISGSSGQAIAAGLIEISMLALFSFAVLQIFGKSQRWKQTLTALSGSGTVVSLFALPVYLLIGFNHSGNTNSDPVYGIGLLVLTLLAFWSIAIMAYVLRHALETSLLFTSSFAIGYVWLILSVSSILIPTELS